jgi:GNAT superfamily N-acetyltransferase
MTADLPLIHPHPDLAAGRALLTTADLPVADLTAAHLDDLWACGAGEDRAGVIGLAVYGWVALLRSLAVAPDWRGQHRGTALLARAERIARHGYVRIPRDIAPPVLQCTAEFAALCPTRAVCLTKPLDAPPG